MANHMPKCDLICNNDVEYVAKKNTSIPVTKEPVQKHFTVAARVAMFRYAKSNDGKGTVLHIHATTYFIWTKKESIRVYYIPMQQVTRLINRTLVRSMSRTALTTALSISQTTTRLTTQTSVCSRTQTTTQTSVRSRKRTLVYLPVATPQKDHAWYIGHTRFADQRSNGGIHIYIEFKL